MEAPVRRCFRGLYGFRQHGAKGLLLVRDGSVPLAAKDRNPAHCFFEVREDSRPEESLSPAAISAAVWAGSMLFPSLAQIFGNMEPKNCFQSEADPYRRQPGPQFDAMLFEVREDFAIRDLSAAFAP
ncbi:MAG TPA: hypothetical protein GXX24_03625 [Paracoccus solventivorans]|uniref:Uncharacterized protein n=1 Tax=Paracoccus solventivorans TaxID=53463 RepID=A0A832PLE1_9RHOB|nr:hypothetical protein [Paracoccus solventivorans]HHW33216.1 hypothetical protein [Paracoccus solventivorans]